MGADFPRRFISSLIKGDARLVLISSGHSESVQAERQPRLLPASAVRTNPYLRVSSDIFLL